jgi:hypothetical protein
MKLHQQPIALHEPFTFPTQVRSAQDVQALLLAVSIREDRTAEQKDADLRRRIVRMRTDSREVSA